MAIKADVTASDDIAVMVDEINQRWGRIDVLVHSTSTPFAVTSFAEQSWDQLCSKLDSEPRAAFLITKAVVPGMARRGAWIHEELIAYVADQEGYFEEEGVRVALRDGTRRETERLRAGATIGLGRVL